MVCGEGKINVGMMWRIWWRARGREAKRSVGCGRGGGKQWMGWGGVGLVKRV